MFRNFLFAILLITTASMGQSPTVPTCKDLKNGVYHQYIKNSNEHYLVYMTENYEKDVELSTGDSTLWENTWQSDCVISQKFISTSDKRYKRVIKYLEKHTLISEIAAVTNDYYLVNIYIDKIKKKPLESDTIWFNERNVIPKSQMFELLPADTIIGKSNFKDTSKYAILYLYRPSKITLSLATYPVYLNDIPMCMVKNNSGYIFKVMKEGNVELKSKLYKDASSATIDVKFGKTYYVKSMINWTITKRLYNFKLEMAAMNNTDGEDEFSKVKVR